MHLGADFFFGGPHAARPDLQAEGDVLEHRHVAEERVVLKDKAHAAFAGGLVGDVLAIEKHRAGVGKFQSRDDAQQRGFPGARRPEQGHQFAGGNLQARRFPARQTVQTSW